MLILPSNLVQIFHQFQYEFRITSVTEASTGDVTIVVGANKLIIMAKPLRLDFYQNDVLTVSANSKGLMRFEHLRTKP